MKILIITEGYPPQIGGLEKVVSEIAHGLKRRGNDVTIFTMTKEINSYAKEDAGINVIYNTFNIKSGKLSYLNGLWKTSKEISHTIRKEKPDVISIQYVGYLAMLFYFINIFWKKPYTVSIHGSDIVKSRKVNSIEKWIINRILNGANKIISNSEYLSQQIEPLVSKSYINKTVTLGNGIHVIDYKPVEYRISDRINIIGIGRFSYKKGFDILISAFSEVNKKKSNCKLILAGDGIEKENCETLSKKMNLQDKIEFTGYIENKDIRNVFERGDIFVLPSRNESFGVVVLEAMAYGVPVIITNSGGVVEIIDNGRTGFIVDVENHVDMAEKIIMLIENCNLRRNFRKLALEEVQKYDWNNIIDRYNDILQNTV